MKKELDFDELKDWQAFEDMIAAYFNIIKSDTQNNLTEVIVNQSGNGPDGGSDILLIFTVNDSICSFTRRWVVQCKFHTKPLKQKEIATLNIPSKIHEYGADGFLLIVKDRVHGNISKTFENLRENCKFKYNYEIWLGHKLKSKILIKEKLLQQFFPEYWAYTQQKEKKAKEAIK